MRPTLLLLVCAACAGELAEPPSESRGGEETPVDPDVVTVDPDATLDALLDTIASEGGGTNCFWLWGSVQQTDAMQRLVLHDGEHRLEGWVTCDEAALERALPPPAGLLLGFRDGILVSTHPSDISHSSPLDGMEPDDRSLASHVPVIIEGDDLPTIGVALPALAEVTRLFGAAMMVRP